MQLSTNKWFRFDSLTVVSLEQAVAAPFATRQLADLGARVIKIERPGSGDFARGYDTTVNGLSSYFVWLNRSKESMTLDLKKPGGAGDPRPAARARRRRSCRTSRRAPPIGSGLDGRLCAHDIRRLIVCSVSGYGTSGPYRRHAKRTTCWCRAKSGLLSLTGTPKTRRAKVGISVADIAAGMYAYSGF